jgi:hypothetical protein
MFIYIYEKKVQTLMVNDFTNINKTKNHVSSQILEQKNKTTTYEVGNPGPGWGQAQKCGGVKPVNGIITLLLVVFCRKYLRTGFFFPTFWSLFICLFINVWFQKHFYRSLLGCLSILYFARLI